MDIKNLKTHPQLKKHVHSPKYQSVGSKFPKNNNHNKMNIYVTKYFTENYSP